MSCDDLDLLHEIIYLAIPLPRLRNAPNATGSTASTPSASEAGGMRRSS
ncbi:MAG: hypothetical protein IPN03_18130 [Holophagales bacterium]|nr:hypothetical protein [Holophagales bacterium]